VDSSSGLLNLLLYLKDRMTGLIVLEVEFGANTSVITTVETVLSEAGGAIVVVLV